MPTTCEFDPPPNNQMDPSPSPQNVVVMRHGDRLDNTDPLWITTAERRWDPPLAEAGLLRAFSTGLKLRDSLPFPIHCVLVSPFLRCVQTASRVVAALCTVDGGAIEDMVPSKVKVAIEYGLCEMLNLVAIKKDAAPKDGNFGFKISDLECLFPDGTVDHSYERVYKEMLQWGETQEAARTRYQQIIVALADKYPDENLLLVTHGEGVSVSVSTFTRDVEVVKVEYCAYSELRRNVLHQEQSFTAGNFTVASNPNRTGIKIAEFQ